MTSTRTISSTTSMPSRSTGSRPTTRLAPGWRGCPGRKFVFTNGDAPYARRVLEAIGVDDHFDELHDIHASELRPKPDPHGYALLCERFGIDPARALLVEDMAQNLKPAKALGHDHGVGRQWLRTRRTWRRRRPSSITSSPMSANGSKPS